MTMFNHGGQQPTYGSIVRSTPCTSLFSSPKFMNYILDISKEVEKKEDIKILDARYEIKILKIIPENLIVDYNPPLNK